MERGLEVLGSLRILAEAKRRSLINTVKLILNSMLVAGYWLDEELIPLFLHEVREADA